LKIVAFLQLSLLVCAFRFGYSAQKLIPFFPPSHLLCLSAFSLPPPFTHNRFAVKLSEIKIEQMVEDFKYQRKIELMKVQETQDLARMKAEKEAGIAASRDWAEECKEDHRLMMERREQESKDRNDQLNKEALEMKAAIEAARETQLEEDKTKILLLKQEFADRKAKYGALFRQKFTLEDAIGSTLARLKRAA
jgi:hypothetical protein